MRIRIAVLWLFLVAPALSHAQSVEVFGSAGPTSFDAGNSVAVGAGFSPHPRVTVAFSFDTTHLDFQTTRDGDVISSFRGGTYRLAVAEARILPFGRDRIGPYGLAGLTAGVSHPNVNQEFPDRITHGVFGIVAGGGFQVPLGRHVSAFADMHVMFGGEGREGVLAVAPVRGGMAWRF